jgi:hypothetical protein
MPIAREVDGVINQGATPEDAYRGLAAETPGPRGSRGWLLAVAFGAQAAALWRMSPNGGVDRALSGEA